MTSVSPEFFQEKAEFGREIIELTEKYPEFGNGIKKYNRWVKTQYESTRKNVLHGEMINDYFIAKEMVFFLQSLEAFMHGKVSKIELSPQVVPGKVIDALFVGFKKNLKVNPVRLEYLLKVYNQSDIEELQVLFAAYIDSLQN